MQVCSILSILSFYQEPAADRRNQVSIWQGNDLKHEIGTLKSQLNHGKDLMVGANFSDQVCPF